jgi:probable HAF family extracellular repeat protein
MVAKNVVKRTWSVVVVAAVVAGAAGSAMSADSYTATVIPPIAGGTGTNASGVNDAGMVVGQGDDASGNVVPFVYEEGATSALPLLSGYTGGNANSVNTAGVIVGMCTVSGSPSRAVKWEKVAGVWTVTDLGTLDPANGGLGVATRINDSGVIVGYSSWASVGGYHATKWDGATKTDLGTLSYTGNLAYSQALGISNMGWVTGYAYRVLGGPEHGLSIAPGGRAEDVTPQEQFGLAQWHNVNDSGTLVGYVEGRDTLGTNDFTPALYVGGQGYTLIPFLGGLQGGYGHDINNAGVAIGEMFLLNAVPEPNVFAAFKYENGVTSDLNAITTGLPGVMEEAKDISETGLIVGTTYTGVPTAVLLTPVTPCAADFDGQNGVTVQDIFAFLNAWFDGGRGADFNGQDGVTVQDIFDFLAAWFAGCH